MDKTQTTKKKPTHKPTKRNPRWIKFKATATSVCPVDPETKVELKFTDKETWEGLAKYLGWGTDRWRSVTHYRVIKPTPKSPSVRCTPAADTGGSIRGNDSSYKNSSEGTPSEGETLVDKWFLKMTEQKSYAEGFNEGLKIGRINAIGWMLTIEFVMFMIAAALR